MQIVYGKWTYTGPLLARKIPALPCRFESRLHQGSDGKYYVTSRLDGFLSVDSGGIEMWPAPCNRWW